MKIHRLLLCVCCAVACYGSANSPSSRRCPPKTAHRPIAITIVRVFVGLHPVSSQTPSSDHLNQAEVALYQAHLGCVSSSHLAKTLNPNRCAVGRPSLRSPCGLARPSNGPSSAACSYPWKPLPSLCSAVGSVRCRCIVRVFKYADRGQACRRGVGRAIEAARRRWSRRLRARRSRLARASTTHHRSSPGSSRLRPCRAPAASPGLRSSRQGPAVCGLAELSAASRCLRALPFPTATTRRSVAARNVVRYGLASHCC